MRYFLRQSIAVSAGVGQLRKQTQREFLPAIQADVQVRAEIISVPVHVGADYYLQAYNQGDFQARAFMGGGFQSLVYSHARLQQVATVGDAFTELILDGKRDSPGYYADVGVHMFFAARFSVLIAGVYRSAMIRQLNQVTTFNGRVIFVRAHVRLSTRAGSGCAALSRSASRRRAPARRSRLISRATRCRRCRP